jgi:DNA-binding MarR family transcriptional regulator
VFAGVALTTVALSAGRAGSELTFPQWRVLVVLGALPDGATTTEIARRVGVTLPATSRQLRRLSARGLIALAPDPKDRRAVRAVLSDGGRELRDAIIAYRRERIASIASEVSVRPTTEGDLARIATAFTEAVESGAIRTSALARGSAVARLG